MTAATVGTRPKQFAPPHTDWRRPTSALKAGTRSRPAGTTFGSYADWSVFETQSLFLPRHYLVHWPELLPVENMAGGAGRLRLERSRLGAVTGDAHRDAGDEDVATRLRMPSIMAMVAVDRRVLRMIEAGRRQKAGEHHDRRDTKRTAGAVGNMAIKAAAVLVENDAECSRCLLAHPGAPAHRIARRRR